MDGDFKFRSVEWTAEQLEAIGLITDWYERGEEQDFYLSGYAGTGKTTLAREIGRRFAFAAPFRRGLGRDQPAMADLHVLGADAGVPVIVEGTSTDPVRSAEFIDRECADLIRCLCKHNYLRRN